MNKDLICYFSASGITKEVAEKISKVVNGDLFEIEPVNKYTEEDLDWTNKNSRSSIEMSDKSSRPKIKNKVNNINDYNRIFIGFPVWWYTAPTIINTFIEENDLNNRNVYIYVTSGSSSVDGSLNDLRKVYPNINFISGKRFSSNVSLEEIKKWVDNE
ncbi:MAG: NAD(P)H-dependent oxidoreductase [Bacilli bacterium]|nr:NAD(P)H-dependent oxidoreductase [Bacilli bacterium]